MSISMFAVREFFHPAYLSFSTQLCTTGQVQKFESFPEDAKCFNRDWKVGPPCLFK